MADLVPTKLPPPLFFCFPSSKEASPTLWVQNGNRITGPTQNPEINKLAITGIRIDAVTINAITATVPYFDRFLS